MADIKDQTEENVDVDQDYDPEAECAGDFKPVQVLDEVKVITGEEQEEVVEKFRTKLYRWRDEQFKERGTGDLKFLKHKDTGRTRILMRQDKTLKIVANFNVSSQDPLCQLIPLKTNDKSWIWSCYDFSDSELVLERLCGRFTTAEEFNRFKTVIDATRVANKALEATHEKKEEKEEEQKEAPKKEEEVAATKAE